jgi:hypothetical protein
MYSWENPDDRVAIVHMNSELRHAQLELLSAHCATHQLRLRYSADDLARFGQRDILHKAVKAASALSEYYTSIERKILNGDDLSPAVPPLTEESIREVSECFSSYLRFQRERYFHSAEPLPEHLKALLQPYFSPALLERVKVTELHRTRVPNPPFYPEARALGFVDLPEFTFMPSLTFLDVVVFNERITERALFHALVHAVQLEVLGIERYAELFVHGFVSTKRHYSLPLEAQVFFLEPKFVASPADRFSVEEQVRLWIKEGRY